MADCIDWEDGNWRFDITTSNETVVPSIDRVHRTDIKQALRLNSSPILHAAGLYKSCQYFIISFKSQGVRGGTALNNGLHFWVIRLPLDRGCVMVSFIICNVQVVLLFFL